MLGRSTATALGAGFSGLRQDIPMLRRSGSIESVSSISSLGEAVPDTDWDEEEEVEAMLTAPPSFTTTLHVTLYRTAVYQLIASWSRTVAQIPSTVYAAGHRSAMSLGQTTAGATNLIRKTWRRVTGRWDPSPSAPLAPPEPPKPARVVRRRRQPIALDEGTYSSVPTTIPQVQGPHPHPPPAPAPPNFQTVVFAATNSRRTFPRPKSLQKAFQWRHIASISDSSDGPPNAILARIDICIEYTRLALGTLHQFRQYFKYGVPSAEVAIESICDNPVLEPVHGEWRPSQAQQPALVVHRMSWQGEKERVFEALKAANTTTLTNLSIHHCSIAMSDVVAILGTWHSLERLEVRDVVPDDQAGTLRFPMQPNGKFKHNLSCLTLTSGGSLDYLVQGVHFLRLSSLALRLYGAANDSDFELLLSNAFSSAVVGNMARTLTLRGLFSASKRLELEAVLGKLGTNVTVDYSLV